VKHAMMSSISQGCVINLSPEGMVWIASPQGGARREKV
jgi:hypothetical protein